MNTSRFTIDNYIVLSFYPALTANIDKFSINGRSPIMINREVKHERLDRLTDTQTVSGHPRGKTGYAGLSTGQGLNQSGSTEKAEHSRSAWNGRLDITQEEKRIVAV